MICTLVAPALCVLATTFALLPAASAADHSTFYTGIREEGMGGAYTAVVNDETAVLLNPAALGKVRDPILTVFDPEVRGSATDPDVLKLKEAPHAFDPYTVMGGLNKSTNWGKNYDAGAQLFPSYVTTNFGLGVLAKKQIDGQIDKTGTNYTVDATTDYAAAMAFNMRYFGGVLKFGGSARFIDRTQIKNTFNVATTTSISVPNDGAEGIGIAADAGAILTVPVEYLPSLALVVHDIGDTSFNHGGGFFAKTGSRRPDPVHQSVDSGFSISPIVGNGKRMSFTAEVQDIGYMDGQAMDHFHTGAELNIGDYFFLRAGLNQRYWTAGVEFDAGLIQLQFASYGQDVGQSGAHLEDRRYSAKVAVRF